MVYEIITKAGSIKSQPLLLFLKLYKSDNLFFIIDLLNSLAHFFQQIACKNKISKTFVTAIHDLRRLPLPLFFSFVYKQNVFTNAHYGIHVVGIDDCCHIVFLSDAMKEFVDDK